MRRSLLAAALLAGCSSAPLESDWERAHPQVIAGEESVALPAYPRDADLVEFAVPGARDFRFFIDAKSLAVGRDGVVRYTFVGRSPGGAENVSFEGLRCQAREYRVYALGHPQTHTWEAVAARWQPVGASRAWRAVLQGEFFCRETVRNADDALERLRQGRWRSGGDY